MNKAIFARRFLLSFVALSSSSLPLFLAAETIERKDRQGRLIERYERDESTRRKGKSETFHPNGKLHIVGEWDGRPLRETEYFDDGKLARKSVYEPKGTHPEIERSEFWQNGSKKLELKRTYKFPMPPIEETKTYFDNGKLEAQYTKRGVRYLGDYKTFDAEGRPREAGKYDDEGVKIGTWRFNTYGDSPETLEETYENGKVSKFTWLDSSGKKVREKTVYPDGSTKEDKKF